MDTNARSARCGGSTGPAMAAAGGRRFSGLMPGGLIPRGLIPHKVARLAAAAGLAVCGLVAAAGLAVCGLAGSALAAYPEKPISLIVGYAAGGGSDFIVRSLAPFIEKELGGSARVIVMNRPGAGGEIGFAAGTGLVHHLDPAAVTQLLFQEGCQRANQQVGAAAGAERHDHRDRLLRIGRLGIRRRSQQRTGRSRQSQSFPELHDPPLDDAPGTAAPGHAARTVPGDAGAGFGRIA